MSLIRRLKSSHPAAALSLIVGCAILSLCVSVPFEDTLNRLGDDGVANSVDANVDNVDFNNINNKIINSDNNNEANSEGGNDTGSSGVKNWDMILSFLALWIVKRISRNWSIEMLEGPICFYPVAYKETNAELHKKGTEVLSQAIEASSTQIVAQQSWKKIPVADRQHELSHLVLRKINDSPIKAYFIKQQNLYPIYENVIFLAAGSVLAHVFAVVSRCFSLTGGAASSWASVFPTLVALTCMYGNLQCYVILDSKQRLISIFSSILITFAVIWTIMWRGTEMVPVKLLEEYISLFFSSFTNDRSPQTSYHTSLLVSLAIIFFTLNLGLFFIAVKSAQLFKSLMFPNRASNGGDIYLIRKPLLILGAVLPLYLALVYNEEFWTLGEAGMTSFFGVTMPLKFKSTVQLGSISIWGMVQLSNLTLYLQKHLFAVGDLLDSGNRNEVKQSVATIARTIVPMAFQLVSVVLVPFGLAFLLHRYSTRAYASQSFGFCELCRNSLNLPPQQAIDNAAIAAGQTAVLMARPFLHDFWSSLTQISTKDNNWIGCVKGLLVKISYLYLPDATAIPLLETLIRAYFSIYSFVFFSSCAAFSVSKSLLDSVATLGGVAKGIKKE